MPSHGFRSFITSATARLAATYLAIIMLLSIGFSIALFNVSAQQLGRQVPPDSFYRTGGQQGPQPSSEDGTTATQQPLSTFSFDGNNREQVREYFEQRVNEGRHTLITRLVYLNILALFLGGLISYVLARRSLEPIEASMEAQALFVSDASHELRTPLTAIQTSNEVFLRRQKATIADAKKLIEQNTDDIKRLKVLSDGLLNLAQHKQMEVITSPVKLQDLVSDAMTQVVPQASEKSIAFDDQVADVSAVANKASLTQALIILLDNAIKYSEPGKTVTLATRQKGKFVFLDVQDQGIGIRASDLPHLFRRFYRADSSRTDSGQNGYGLGLAIAKQIMDGHHGDIETVSTPGKGSTFTLKIPTA